MAVSKRFFLASFETRDGRPAKPPIHQPVTSREVHHLGLSFLGPHGVAHVTFTLTDGRKSSEIAEFLSRLQYFLEEA